MQILQRQKNKILIHNSCVVRSIHLERGEAAGTWIGGRILKGATKASKNIDSFYFMFIFARILLQELQHQEILCRYFYEIDQNIISVCWLEGGHTSYFTECGSSTALMLWLNLMALVMLTSSCLQRSNFVAINYQPNKY